MHVCSRALLLFGKSLQWNLHVNCHVNRTTFQSGLSVLRVSCKRALKQSSWVRVCRTEGGSRANLRLCQKMEYFKHWVTVKIIFITQIGVNRFFQYSASNDKCLEHVYMRPEVNPNRFEISLRRQLTPLSACTWLRTKWNLHRCKFHFVQFYQSKISNCREFSM